jgi:hypothetical protein
MCLTLTAIVRTPVFLLTFMLIATPVESRKVYPPSEPFPVPVVRYNGGQQLSEPTHKPIPQKSIKEQKLEDYMLSLKSRAYKNWRPPANAARNSTIHFFIEPNGTFHDIDVARSSGNKQADSACVEAIIETSGFQSKVPEEVREVAVTFILAEKSKKERTAQQSPP